jgi:hypothetical protein
MYNFFLFIIKVYFLLWTNIAKTIEWKIMNICKQGSIETEIKK